MKRWTLAALAAALIAVLIVLIVTPGPPNRLAPLGTSPPVAVVHHKLIPRRLGVGYKSVSAPIVGEVLAITTPAVWTNSPTSFSYAWVDCNSSGVNCVTISGATSTSYTVRTSDSGDELAVVATACNTFGCASQESNLSGVVAASGGGSLTFDGTFEQPQSGGSIQPFNSVPQCANFEGGQPAGAAHYAGDFYFDNGTRTPANTNGTLFNDAMPTGIVPPGAGSYSGRYVEPTTPGGYNLTACTTQGLIHNSPYVGQTIYYGMMFYLPVGMTLNSPGIQGTNLEELLFNAVWGDPIAVELHTGAPGNTNNTTNSVALSIETGPCNNAQSSSPGCAYRSQPGNPTACTGNGSSPPTQNSPDCNLGRNFVIPPGQVQYGVWNEYVLAINVESNTTGQIQAWYKVKGAGSWTASADVTGIPTVQWNAPSGCCTSTVKDDPEIYNGKVSSPFQVNFDNIVSGNTLAVVQAQMP